MTTTHFHSCGFAVPQINTVPSIRYSTINANHKPEAVYQGHLNDGSSVQVHSTDPLYRQHGVHLRCIQGANGRRIWQATKGDAVIFSHPKHDAALAGAVMTLTGA